MQFAQRTITRAATSEGERHIVCTQDEFAAREARGEFAMAWRAHGNAYGIGREIHDWLAAGDTVVVSGSREYAPQALETFPDMQMVLVTASSTLLRTRLEARGRETGHDIAARLERFGDRGPRLENYIEIRNDGRVVEAGQQLLALLLGATLKSEAKTDKRRTPLVDNSLGLSV